MNRFETGKPENFPGPRSTTKRDLRLILRENDVMKLLREKATSLKKLLHWKWYSSLQFTSQGNATSLKNGNLKNQFHEVERKRERNENYTLLNHVNKWNREIILWLVIPGL